MASKRGLALARRLTSPHVALATLVLLTILDGLGQQDVGLSVLYLFPVIALAWHGTGLGALGAAVATVGWLVTDIMWSRHPSGLNVALNGGFRLLFFAIVAAAVPRIRHDREVAHRLNAQLTQALNHADRLATTGRLASGIAHELGTPLNVVSARARLLEDGEASAAEVNETARIIREQVARMTAIIRQLLDYSRRREPDRLEQDLRPIARRVVELLGTLAARSNTSLVLEVQDEPVEAEVDSVQMEQVLSNIIVNAMQAEPKGPIRIAVRQAMEADPGGEGVAMHPTVVVKDDGVGIATTDLPHIFEPFFTTKDVGKGTGLGLTVAHGIVVAHGGWLAVESVPGQGTTFRIVLPDPDAPVATQGTKGGRGRRRRAVI